MPDWPPQSRMARNRGQAAATKNLLQFVSRYLAADRTGRLAPHVYGIGRPSCPEPRSIVAGSPALKLLTAIYHPTARPNPRLGELSPNAGLTCGTIW